MVKKFPIDYMHQLCLGVMRKLVMTWIKGDRRVRSSAGQVQAISTKLSRLKQYVPSCFARKPRGWQEVERWKASEYRQFLLYTGKVVLRGVLRPDVYEHFLCLSVASCMLISPDLAEVHATYAGELLKHFVEKGRSLYGNEFLVYNVHSMLHLKDEAEEYGSLDACSAFMFENYMQKIKRLVRSGKKPIAQIAKRLSESSGIIPQRSDYSITPKTPDNVFIVNESSCCEVIDDGGNVDGEGNRLFMCRLFENTVSWFESPCDSRLIGTHKASLQRTRLKLLSSKVLTRRAIKVDLGSTDVLFMALLHNNN